MKKRISRGLNLNPIKGKRKSTIQEVPDLIQFPPSPEDTYADINDFRSAHIPAQPPTITATQHRTLSRSTSSPVETTNPVPQSRKKPLIQSKSSSQMPTHSQLSIVKKALTGIEESTPFHKCMYHEKRVVETLEKYILAKQESADAWSVFMNDESNMAIRHVYEKVCELDRLWVQQHNKIRSEFSEARKLFKLLNLGEQNLHQEQKRATGASNRVAKIQKQMDDALAKGRSSKGNIDLRKLEQIQRDLERAVKVDEEMQRQFQNQTKNNQIFKYNKIQKMLSSLAETEVELYQDCWKIAEVKLQIIKTTMGRAFSKITATSLQQGKAESCQLLGGLYTDLGMAPPPECELERPPQPLPHTRAAPLQILPHTRAAPAQHHPPLRSVPSAPSADIISMRGSIRSQSSGEGSEFEMDACYNPIPDLNMDEDEANSDTEYIYEFEDAEFDENDEDIYENYETDRKYLDLEDDTVTTPTTTQRQNRSTNVGGPPKLPPRKESRQQITQDDIYEETDGGDPEPNFPPPAMSSNSAHEDEDIFGTLSDLNLRKRPNPTAARTSQTLPQQRQAHGQQQTPSIWPSLSGLGQSLDAPDDRGSYSEMWESRSGQSGSNDSSASSSRESSINANMAPRRTGSAGSTGSQSHSGSDLEARYVSGPGTTNSGKKPAKSTTIAAPRSNFEMLLADRLQIFQTAKTLDNRNNDAPPPLPARRTPTNNAQNRR